MARKSEDFSDVIEDIAIESSQISIDTKALGAAAYNLSGLDVQLSGGANQSLLTSDDLQFTMTGMQVHAELSYDQWAALLPKIHAIKSAYQWIIGDWINYGIKCGWHTTYDDISERIGVKAATLEEYAYIARGVSERSETLGMQHHRPVIGLAPEWQRAIVDLASENKWSVRNIEMAVDMYNQGQTLDNVVQLISVVSKKRKDPLEKAEAGQIKARYEVIKRAKNKKQRGEWAQYAEEQARAWLRLKNEIEAMDEAE